MLAPAARHRSGARAEATTTQDQTAHRPAARELVREALSSCATTWRPSTRCSRPGDEPAAILAAIETHTLTALLGRAAGFAIARTGWGFALWRSAPVQIALDVCRSSTRWTAAGRVRQAADGVRRAADGNGRAAIRAAARAEMLVAASAIHPLPALAGRLAPPCSTQRAAFAARRGVRRRRPPARMLPDLLADDRRPAERRSRFSVSGVEEDGRS